MTEFLITAMLTDLDLLNSQAKPRPGVVFFSYWFIAFKIPAKEPTFTVEQASAAAAKPAQVPISPSDMIVSKQPPQLAVWFFRVAVAPGTRVTVEVALAGDNQFPRQDVFAFDPAPNTGAPVMLFPRNENPPRLVLALNSTFVPDPKTLPRFEEFANKKGSSLDFANPGSFEVRYLLNHIYDRLSADFIAPWFGPDGGPSARVASTSKLTKDEHWARLMAELFMLQPYTTPSTAYQGTGMQFADEQMLFKLQDDEDPAYPIVGECQHHVTAAALGRGMQFAVDQSQGKDGVKRPRLHTMFTAGPSKGAVDALSPGGEASWTDAGTGTTKLADLDPKFKPGSAFSFNNHPPSQAPANHPHIAYVVRVVRNDKDVVQKIQFFDVGGMNVTEPNHPALQNLTKAPVGSDFNNYTYEYPWSNSGKEGALGAYAGTAEISAKDDTLDAGISRLSRARPIGIARLVLARRTNPTTGKPTDFTHDAIDDWLLYASPLLRMHESSSERNYSIARYLWSLRELPGADQIQAIWQISVPRGVMVDAMVFGLGSQNSRQPTGRQLKIADLVKDLAARRPADKINTDGTKALSVQGFILGVCDLSGRSDGSVMLLDCVKSDFKTSEFHFLDRDGGNATLRGAFAAGHLPWGQETTKARTVDLATFSDVPPYFRDQT